MVGGEPGFSCAMESFHPSASLCSCCFWSGWIQHRKSTAEVQKAANSLASYPSTAGLELTPAFSVLAQENRMIPGLVFICNPQSSLIDQALLQDSDKSSNPSLLVCHYPSDITTLFLWSIVPFSSLICSGCMLLGLGTPSTITIQNPTQSPCLSQQHLIRKLHYF